MTSMRSMCRSRFRTAICRDVYKRQDLLWPTLVTRDNTWRTLPQALRGLNDSVYTFWGQIFAFSAMITLPILAIFLAFQKQFVQSVAMSGIKG